MMIKTIVLATAVALTGPALAQAPAAAPASAPAASKAKKELVAKVLQLQRAGIEGAARVLAEQPSAPFRKNWSRTRAEPSNRNCVRWSSRWRNA